MRSTTSSSPSVIFESVKDYMSWANGEKSSIEMRMSGIECWRFDVKTLVRKAMRRKVSELWVYGGGFFLEVEVWVR